MAAPALQLLHVSRLVEKINVLMFEAPAAAAGAEVRLEGEARDIAEQRAVVALDEQSIFGAAGNAMAHVAAGIEVLIAGGFDLRVGELIELLKGRVGRHELAHLGVEAGQELVALSERWIARHQAGDS